MAERPRSRYTRAKTWAALYSQHITAGYALVPWSGTNNSIAVIRCKSPEEVQTTMRELFNQEKEWETFYGAKQTPEKAPDEPEKAPDLFEKARQAVVLARSSDYYHYHLSEERPDVQLVICGLHDSYLHLPVWEMRTNTRYKPRVTSVAISSPDFEKISRTQFGHTILIGALICGDPEARAFFSKHLKSWTQRRITRKVQELQHLRYRGRPLAFLNEEKRRAIGQKISEGLKRYHEQKRLKQSSP